MTNTKSLNILQTQEGGTESDAGHEDLNMYSIALIGWLPTCRHSSIYHCNRVLRVLELSTQVEDFILFETHYCITSFDIFNVI